MDSTFGRTLILVNRETEKNYFYFHINLSFLINFGCFKEFIGMN